MLPALSYRCRGSTAERGIALSVGRAAPGVAVPMSVFPSVAFLRGRASVILITVIGMEPDSPAFGEGLDAYCRGVPRAACPYAPGAPQHDDWLRGWDEAEAIDFEESRA